MSTTQQKIYNLGIWLLKSDTLEMMWDTLPGHARDILDDALEDTGTMELVLKGENQFGITMVTLEYTPDVAQVLKVVEEELDT